MIFRYYGHSFFTIELANGLTIATDPYGDFYQYPVRKIAADVCFISHGHDDHCGKSCITGTPLFIEREGKSSFRGINIKAVPSFHDEVGGAKRGSNLFFVMEADGLRIGHAGDIGQVLTQSQLKEIGKLDILMFPVGGYYTCSLNDTMTNLSLLKPRVTIPMHYRTNYNPEMPIAPLEVFLAAVRAQDTQMPLVRITAEDISERPAYLTMSIVP